MVSLEVIALVLTGLGLTASIVYYANVLSNANKTQQTQLETRQAQLFMQSYRETSTVELQTICFELLAWQWIDYKDFKTKYLSQPKEMGKFVTYMLFWHGLGVLLHEKYVPIETFYKMDQDGAAPIMFWEKFKQVTLDMRKSRNQPNLFKYFEYYVEEMIKLRKKNGLPVTWSIDETRFI